MTSFRNKNNSHKENKNFRNLFPCDGGCYDIEFKI